MESKQCSVCGSQFTCDADQGSKSCWCNQYPSVMPVDNVQGCQCPTCLVRTIAATINQTINNNSHEHMLELARNYKDQNQFVEHIDYTIENGNTVFSRWYHLKRGECCGNGCRNCPY